MRRWEAMRNSQHQMEIMKNAIFNSDGHVSKIILDRVKFRQRLNSKWHLENDPNDLTSNHKVVLKLGICFVPSVTGAYLFNAPWMYSK